MMNLLLSKSLDRYLIKYLYRLFFFTLILLPSPTWYHFYFSKSNDTERFLSIYIIYLLLTSLVYYFWIERSCENRYIKYGRILGLGFFRELSLSITISRYSITGFTAFILVLSSVVGIFSKTVRFEPVTIYLSILSFIVGFAFRFGVISWINKIELRQGFTDDFILILMPSVLMVTAFFDTAYLARFIVLNFSLGVVTHMIFLYFNNLYFVENRNGHIAVWDDPPERFMIGDKQSYLSKTLLMLRKGTRISAYRVIIYLEMNKNNLCVGEICDNSNKEYYVNKCRAYLILKKFDSLLSLYEDAEKYGIKSKRLDYLKCQALIFIGKYNEAIFILEDTINSINCLDNEEMKHHNCLKYFYVRIAEGYAIKSFLEKDKKYLKLAIGYLHSAVEMDKNCIISNTYYVYFLVLSETIEKLQCKEGSCKNHIMNALFELKKIKINSKDTTLINNLEIMEIFSFLLTDIGANLISKEAVRKYKVDESFNSYVFANQGLILEMKEDYRNAMFNYLRAILIKDSSLDPLAPAIARARFENIQTTCNYQ